MFCLCVLCIHFDVIVLQLLNCLCFQSSIIRNKTATDLLNPVPTTATLERTCRTWVVNAVSTETMAQEMVTLIRPTQTLSMETHITLSRDQSHQVAPLFNSLLIFCLQGFNNSCLLRVFRRQTKLFVPGRSLQATWKQRPSQQQWRWRQRSSSKQQTQKSHVRGRRMRCDVTKTAPTISLPRAVHLLRGDPCPVPRRNNVMLLWRHHESVNVELLLTAMCLKTLVSHSWLMFTSAS